MKSVYLASMLASVVMVFGGGVFVVTPYWPVGIACIGLGLIYFYFNWRNWSRLKKSGK